jgi:diguanylate cyclase (GGDEF)-like protein
MRRFRFTPGITAGFLLVLFAGLYAGFLPMRNGPGRVAYVDAANILTVSLGGLGCALAAARRRGRFRLFWSLFAGAFFLQCVGNVGWAWVHAHHVAVSHNALFPSIFYRLYAAPIALALFLPNEARKRRTEDFLDGLIAIALVLVTMYQVQSAETVAGDPHLWRVISAGTAVNLILIVAAIGRWWYSSHRSTRTIFGRMAIYLVVYAAVALVTSLDDAYLRSLDSIDDLFWTVTYLTGAAVAFSWDPGSTSDEAPDPRLSRRASLLCFNLTLAAMVLGGAIIGLRAMAPERIVSLSGVSVVLLSFAVRSALMQDRQEKYFVALTASQEQLRRQALFDELTGLPNRRMFSERLGQALALARRESWELALLYLDLDGFKPVNDRYGHAVGDLLMTEVARRLQGRVRESDTLARVGGDEFTLVATHLKSAGDAKRLAEDLLRHLHEPFQIGTHAIHVSASIGIAIFPKDSTQPAELIERADHAMYQAKGKGSGGIAHWLQ